MKHTDTPQILLPMSPEDLEKLPRLTDEAIRKAIEAGERDRRAAESAPSSAPITPRMLYR
jgi:hypothetical protein